MRYFIIILQFVAVNTYAQKTSGMNLIDFDDGTFTFFKDLEEVQVQAIKDKVAKDNVILNYKGIEGLHIYKNATGVMVLLDELSVLCDNMEVLDKAIGEGYLTEVTRKDIMYKKNPFGNNFPSKAPELVNSLLKELGIDAKSDLDAGLLETVEARIRNLQKPYHFYRSHFIEIIALLGEVFKKRDASLSWNMKLSNDKQTLNPYLIGQNQREYPFFIDFYEQLFINNELDYILTFIYGIYE